MKVNPDPPTIHETSFEQEISRRCQAGELCPIVLHHGDYCGRELDARGHNLCTWHTDRKLGIIPKDEYPGACSQHTCCDCGERAVSFRVTMRCKPCHRRFLADRDVMKRYKKPVPARLEEL